MSTASKYKSIEKSILHDIHTSQYTDKIPSERALAKIYHASPLTIRRALENLTKKNILRRVMGSGTYLNADYKSEISIFLSNTGEICSALRTALKIKFPYIAFNISSQPGIRDENFYHSYDILSDLSYCPFAYENLFLPIKPQTIQKYLDESRYYTGAFNIHRENGNCYGFPLLFSPRVLVYNRELLRTLTGESTLRNFENSDLVSLQKKITAKKNIFLFDAFSSPKVIILSYVYANLAAAPANRENLDYIPPDAFEKGLENFWLFYKKTLAGQADFSKGNVLFSFAYRQTMQLLQRKLSFPWDIAPVPVKNTFKIITPASESLFITKKCRNPEICTEICEYFLSADMQNIFSRFKYGIPVLKSSALSGIGDSPYRDDIFFSEIKHFIYHYSFFSKDLMNTFIAKCHELFKQKIGFPDFCNAIRELYKSQDNSIRDRMQVARQAYFQGMDAGLPYTGE
ncbi:MAG TPA: hypothetical protein DC049_10255 [Spirochaetia bacterium]|nr:hypothetical protein [Spirochaetia bacterium]